MMIAGQTPGGLFDPVRVAKALMMLSDEFAICLGLDGDLTFGTEWSKTPLAQRRMSALMDVMNKVAPRFATQALANTWYRSTALPSFSGMTAQDLVAANRSAAVIDYIEAVDAGVFA
jgi:hypothetical protein